MLQALSSSWACTSTRAVSVSVEDLRELHESSMLHEFFGLSQDGMGA